MHPVFARNKEGKTSPCKNEQATDLTIVVSLNLIAFDKHRIQLRTSYIFSYQKKLHVRRTYSVYFFSIEERKRSKKTALGETRGLCIKHNVGRRGNGQAHGSSFVLQSKHDKWGRVWHD